MIFIGAKKTPLTLPTETDPKKLCRDAQALQEKKEWQQALKIYGELWKLRPTDDLNNKILLNTGICLQELECFSDAELNFEEWIKTHRYPVDNTRHFDVVNRYANCLLMANKGKKVLELYREARNFYNNFSAFPLLAEAYALEGDFRVAHSQLNFLLRTSPIFYLQIQVSLRRAKIFMLENKLEAAREILQSYLELKIDPDSREADALLEIKMFIIAKNICEVADYREVVCNYMQSDQFPIHKKLKFLEDLMSRLDRELLQTIKLALDKHEQRLVKNSFFYTNHDLQKIWKKFIDTMVSSNYFGRFFTQNEIEAKRDTVDVICYSQNCRLD